MFRSNQFSSVVLAACMLFAGFVGVDAARADPPQTLLQGFESTDQLQQDIALSQTGPLYSVWLIESSRYVNVPFGSFMPDRVFTGDTLLIRGTGRTDFQNGDPRAQYESLFGRLLKLPNETLVYPAHDYKGDTGSTNAVFTVTLTGATELPATASFTTANGTAVAGAHLPRRGIGAGSRRGGDRDQRDRHARRDRDAR